MTAINPLTQQPFEKDELKHVIQLCNKLIALEAEQATMMLVLEKKTQEVNLMRMTTLPAAMGDLGLNSLQLENGGSIEIAPYYSCSVSDKDPDLKAKALKWLRKEAPSLIKHEVKVVLGTESEKELASLRGWLNKKSMPFKDGQGVNAATLKSFMKERVEDGKPFPLDLFKGYIGKIAKTAMPEAPKQ